jgi:hypothetical protein
MEPRPRPKPTINTPTILIHRLSIAKMEDLIRERMRIHSLQSWPQTYQLCQIFPARFAMLMVWQVSFARSYKSESSPDKANKRRLTYYGCCAGYQSATCNIHMVVQLLACCKCTC